MLIRVISTMPIPLVLELVELGLVVDKKSKQIKLSSEREPSRPPVPLLFFGVAVDMRMIGSFSARDRRHSHSTPLASPIMRAVDRLQALLSFLASLSTHGPIATVYSLYLR